MKKTFKTKFLTDFLFFVFLCYFLSSSQLFPLLSKWIHYVAIRVSSKLSNNTFEKFSFESSELQTFKQHFRNFFVWIKVIRAFAIQIVRNYITFKFKDWQKFEKHLFFKTTRQKLDLFRRIRKNEHKCWSLEYDQ